MKFIGICSESMLIPIRDRYDELSLTERFVVSNVEWLNLRKVLLSMIMKNVAVNATINVNSEDAPVKLWFSEPLFICLYLDVKCRHLDTEKLFAYRAVSRSFLST